MKIMKLYLENFSPIWYKLNKKAIDLDFSNTSNIINVIIGEMGSCKTMILGHLQPFSSFGSIDVRNGDDLILENKVGIKIIEIRDGDDYYIIKHEYLPKDSKHTVKSYFSKNGREMNPNGNQSSFKDLIEIEFGIDSTYLTLIRLGANVQNIINLKSTDRKTFIGNKLRDVEFYNLLLKDLKEENRKLSAHVEILAGKLNNLKSDKYDIFQGDIRRMSAYSMELKNKKDSLSKLFYQLQAQKETLLENSSLDEYLKKLNTYESTYNTLSDRYSNKLIKLNDLKCFDIKAAKERILVCQALIPQMESEVQTLSEDYNEKNDKLRSLKDKLAVSQNSIHLETLQNEISNVERMINEYQEELKNFKITKSSLSVKKDLSDVNTFSEMLSSLIGYTNKSILTVYKSDSSILQAARKRIEILEKTKMKKMRELNNMQFSNNYTADRVLFIPPGCPSRSCPFIQTHPCILKKSNHDEYREAIRKIKGEIDELDREIEIYSGFPVLYKIILSIKDFWKDLSKSLKELGVLLESDLKVILTSRVVWYDYDKLINIIELCEKRQMLYDLTEKYQSIKMEFNKLSSDNQDDLIKSIDSMEESIHITYDTLINKRNNLEELENELSHLNELYESISLIESLEKEIKEDEDQIRFIGNEINRMKDTIPKIEELGIQMNTTRHDIDQVSLEFNNLNQEINSITITLDQIDSTKEEFERVREEQKYIKYMIKASSSKEGLPLILIKRFIDSTRSIVNDLLADVFGETIEILDFEIDETNFNIPYSVNGSYVSDINRASQGQQSIISLALSFALMQKFMTKFNIPLLDEVDGPLYKDDRAKFIDILFRQINAINAEQVFLITHNNTFDGYPVNVIMTTDEVIDDPEMVHIIKV